MWRTVTCALFISPILLTASSIAQDGSSKSGDPDSTPAVGDGIAIKLDLSRRFLKNFLLDEAALEPYSATNGSIADFHGAFTIAAADSRYAVIWDPVSCRIVGVLDLAFEAPVATPVEEETEEASDEDEVGEEAETYSPYVLIASGLTPLSKSEGVFGTPEYFGFRLVEGKPEFLYLQGKVAVEERLWLESRGTVLKQRYHTRDAVGSLAITIPEPWKSRVSSSAGEWDGPTLRITSDGPIEVVLSYLLEEPDTESEEDSP
ncbi:MAG: hypothetical protein AAGC68_10280 [Verrucomicrobiota bacterium]